MSSPPPSGALLRLPLRHRAPEPGDNHRAAGQSNNVRGAFVCAAATDARVGLFIIPASCLAVSEVCIISLRSNGHSRVAKSVSTANVVVV